MTYGEILHGLCCVTVCFCAAVRFTTISCANDKNALHNTNMDIDTITFIVFIDTFFTDPTNDQDFEEKPPLVHS